MGNPGLARAGRTALEGVEISRHHAEFRVDGPLVTICDLGSSNGVHINSERRDKAPLRLGDVVRCGEWVGVVVADIDPLGFREIASGWYGGAVLAAAAQPVRRLADDIPIILQGETGTGKEGMARAIHSWSDRRTREFIAPNCATIPAGLAESELFGFKKGAFSGAHKDSPGLFRTANKGTIFLDEILELPLAVQAKLLRVLELREVLPLGDTQPIPIDVRLVVASQESLAIAVEDGRFRTDLYARLDGYTVLLPPLRNRREDVVPLFQRLWLERTNGHAALIDSKFAEALSLYDWPLNVRELVLLVRRLASIHGVNAALKKRDLPDRILTRVRRAHTESGMPPVETDKRSWRRTDDDSDFDSLVAALRDSGGNVTRAAAVLGITRARANRLLSAHAEFSLNDVRSDG